VLQGLALGSMSVPANAQRRDVRYRYVVVLHVNSALGGSFALGQTSRGVPVGVFAGHEGGILLATRSANVGSGGMEDRGVREAHLGGHFLELARPAGRALAADLPNGCLLCSLPVGSTGPPLLPVAAEVLHTMLRLPVRK